MSRFDDFYEQFCQWRLIQPGSRLQHASGSVLTVERRKTDNSGWWMTDQSGLGDRAFLRGDWTLVGWTKPLDVTP